MLDQPITHCSGLRAQRAASLPVAELIVGKSVDEAAALLPRLFNLCRSAQDAAARLAFGLPLDTDQVEQVRLEILREHLIVVCIKLPAHFDRGSVPLPEGWKVGTGAARRAVFGPSGELPANMAGFVEFMDSKQGIAEIFGGIRDGFAPGEACSERLPSVCVANALSAVALENSVAGRQASHPVMRAIEHTFGRGPFWRAVARVYDAQDCMNGHLPDLLSPQPGVAIVPAARGTYAVSAQVEDGIVKAFRRITPTDHLLAGGGVLDQTLARLPSKKFGMSALLLDILDPCTPVHLEGADHA